MNKELMDSISKMAVNNNRLELPAGDFFSNYAEVKKALVKAGGKYKKCGFEFATDPQIVKDRLTGGEDINDKKKYQFFATPEAIANILMENLDAKPQHKMLEPSAGRGALIETFFSKKQVDCIELMPDNYNYLQKEGYNVIGTDFTKMNIVEKYDRIIANPPFTKNQDIDHVRLMYKALKEGGRLVSIMSPHWRFANDKKSKEFREWIKSIDAEWYPLEAGLFKESGTNIETLYIIIDK